MLEKVGIKVGIIGAGHFGTALARVLSGAYKVCMWSRSADIVNTINKGRFNPRYFQHINLGANVSACEDIRELLDLRIVFIAIPANSVQEILPSLRKGPVYVSCAKGVDVTDKCLVHQKLSKVMGAEDVCVLSGPNFASDLVCGYPSGAIIAGQRAQEIALLFQESELYVQASPDMEGVGAAGAFKNVIAVVCGMAEGFGWSHSQRAVLFIKLIEQMQQFILSQGGVAQTLLGIAGLGDLWITTSHQSRNYRHGYDIARGVVPEQCTCEALDTLQVLDEIFPTEWMRMLRKCFLENSLSELRQELFKW